MRDTLSYHRNDELCSGLFEAILSRTRSFQHAHQQSNVYVIAPTLTTSFRKILSLRKISESMSEQDKMRGVSDNG